MPGPGSRTPAVGEMTWWVVSLEAGACPGPRQARTACKAQTYAYTLQQGTETRPAPDAAGLPGGANRSLNHTLRRRLGAGNHAG
jgi:hypothetical protein